MNAYSVNPRVDALAKPPVAEVQRWICDRQFSADSPLLDVSQAVPGYGPAQAMIEHLSERLREVSTARYTDIIGMPELREAMSEHISDDYQGHVRADQIAITSGCNQAFCAVIDAIVQPGDEVILTVPYYFNHQMWLDIRGIDARLAPFNPDGEPRCSDIESCVTPKTRAIVLVTPNNPTGLEYSPEMIGEVFELARKLGLALIIDETYKDFRSSEAPPHHLHQDPKWHDTLIQLFSFSKSFAMTGYRVGAIAGSGSLIEQVEKIMDNLVICPSHPGQIAALYALRNLGGWRHDKAAMLRERVHSLKTCFERGDLRYRLVFSGAYFAYIRHPFGSQAGSFSVARRLAERFNVLSLPGGMFGPLQDEFLRFAFANIDADQIQSLIDRLVQSQDSIGA